MGTSLQLRLSMRYTIHDAEQALQHGRPNDDTLKRYSVDILQELCARRKIKIVQKGSRRLKRPYIDALLHVAPVSTQSLLPASTAVDNHASKKRQD